MIPVIENEVNIKFDINVIEDYIKRGLIEKNDHPSFPISIYNYTRECAFERKWDDITLSCRGLVLDKDGYVVARPFKKFFNMEEMDSIPNAKFDVFEKMDGSLGIAFHYRDDWHMATRGSFVSDQAIRGREMLQKYIDNPHCELHPEYTYLFEIIYKENRIVVDYDFEDLVLLARIRRNTCVPEGGVHGEGFQKYFKVVKKYDGVEDYSTLKKMVDSNKEGFVLRFYDGKNTRMKIKGEEYVRLHSLLTNFSNVDIWKCLKAGEDINQFLERVPDEFDAWVRKTVKELRYAAYSIREECGKIHDYFRYGKYNDRDPELTKKEFVEYVQRRVKEKALHGILFAMWDGNNKKVDDIIWKLIRPKYQKPFWNKQVEEE